MTTTLDCYGPEIEQVADLVGDFSLRSRLDLDAWYAIQWKALAELLGFSQQLAAAPSTRGDSPIGAAQEAGLAAFERSLRDARPGVSDAQGRVQLAALTGLASAGRERGELWRVTVDPTTLPMGACFTDGGQSLRAFYPDTAPGYFGDGWDGPRPRAASACGWQTPLVLHLGTFPWIYSTRLDGAGPGARWVSSTTQPALEGLRAAVSLMDPVTPLLARVPVLQPGRAEAGRLYRRNGFLHVHQGSLHVAGLDGPRGRISAPAYNHILRRFACFFAVRRSTLRDLTAMPRRRPASDPQLRRPVPACVRGGGGPCELTSAVSERIGRGRWTGGPRRATVAACSSPPS
ncbi:hypothetical protein [Nannocystis sp.]|uniref:hypothetical protein n=1 Tax=Nannocystis sp. TaxID=1962667 RepID=UPI0025F77880|nr:hypothetical protein [Nannocystis sp.]MBK7829383.1 hypothetical protein [Nannocystis sp.]